MVVHRQLMSIVGCPVTVLVGLGGTDNQNFEHWVGYKIAPFGFDKVTL